MNNGELGTMASAYEEEGLPETPTDDPERKLLIGSSNESLRTYGGIQRDCVFLENEAAQEPHLRYVTVKSSSSIPTDTSIVPSSLRAVRKLIMKPYNFLFKLVAFQPLFPRTQEHWLKFVNVLHPVVVLLVIMFASIIITEECVSYFKKKWKDTCLIPSGDITDSTTISTSVNSTLGVVAERLAESRSNTGCDTNVGVQFVIRKILHTISYLYSLYSMRCAEPEQFVSLLERVFLFMKQLGIDLEAERRVVKSSRWLLYYGAMWIVLSMAMDSMFLYSRFDLIYLPWICTPSHRIILCCGVMVSFTLLNAVYVTIVLTYAVQCGLLTIYIECLIKRIRENTTSLFDAMEKCNEFRKEVDKLNRNAGISVSIVLVNFASIIGIQVVECLQAIPKLKGDYQNDYSFIVLLISNILSTVLTFILAAVVINQAMTLTRSCGVLRKMGMEVRVRSPLKFEFSQSEDVDLNYSIEHKTTSPFSSLFEDRLMPMRIDTFLAYMASLSFSAKLFMLPVRGGYVCLFCIITGFGFFFYYQFKDISASIHALGG